MPPLSLSTATTGLFLLYCIILQRNYLMQNTLNKYILIVVSFTSQSKRLNALEHQVCFIDLKHNCREIMMILQKDDEKCKLHYKYFTLGPLHLTNDKFASQWLTRNGAFKFSTSRSHLISILNSDSFLAISNEILIKQKNLCCWRIWSSNWLWLFWKVILTLLMNMVLSLVVAVVRSSGPKLSQVVSLMDQGTSVLGIIHMCMCLWWLGCVWFFLSQTRNSFQLWAPQWSSTSPSCFFFSSALPWNDQNVLN